jgi:hypothetical protein
MSYKVTISDAVLEKCIEHVTFYVDTPNHYDMRTDPKNSMIITGKIDTDEGTAILYKWALLPATNPDCYKEITVEYTKDSQLVRKVCFSKAFVVDYSESYSNYSGVGTFTLYVRQFRGKDIEYIGQTSRPSTVESSITEEVKEEIEVAKEQSPVAEKVSTSKSAMSITDRIAKQKEMMDNGTNDDNIMVPSKADLDAYRKELNVSDINTIAVGKTDVKELRDITFKGASPKVRKEANLPDLDTIAPNRSVKAPTNVPLNRNHAEEALMHEFDEAVKTKGLNQENIKGNLNIHQSNSKGVCPTCLQGLTNPNVKPGIFKQFSEKYPNLTIKVTSEGSKGVKPFGRQAFTMLNGKILDK